METTIRSSSKSVVIGSGRPTIIIGERINPTGRKRLSQALAEGDLELVRQEARAQVAAGADVLDVNVGAPNVNEVEMLPAAVKAVMETVDVPLCIDTASPEALEAALAVYEGKALVNSVNGEAASISRKLPIVKKYGAAVIALTMDDAGIPTAYQKRLEIARHILHQAEGAGIPPEDVVIDCLVLTVSTDQSAGATTLKTIEEVTKQMGLNTTIGASNISFGLPDRDVVNAAFLNMAISVGLTSAIVDPAKSRKTILAADLLLGRDRFARRYIANYRASSR